MRPILCAIDLSDESCQVLTVAATMACAYKSQLTILYPYRLIDNSYTGEILKLKAKLEQDAKDKFGIVKNQIPILDQLTFEFLPEIGFLADRINYFVKRNKTCSVVISQRQATLMNESDQLTFQNLITNSKLPFTIVPEEIDIDTYTH